MKNPLEAVKAIASTISLAGKAVGTAERVFKAATADVDNDGKPELKNAAEGLVKAFGKLKDMGKVMAVLKKHGGALDMSRANRLVKAKLGG